MTICEYKKIIFEKIGIIHDDPELQAEIEWRGF